MKTGDRVMVVANHAIREDKSSMGTLDSYVRTDPDPYGGYHVETWMVLLDGDDSPVQCNLLVDESCLTEKEVYHRRANEWG